MKDVVREYFKTSGETKKVLNRVFIKVLSDKYIRKLILNTSMQVKKITAKPDKKAETKKSKNVKAKTSSTSSK